MYQDIIIKVLTSVPIYKGISKESLTKLTSIAKLSQYPKGSTVFSEGDPGDCLYIVASGRVDIYTRTGSGDGIILNTLGPAEVFGEMALLDGLPRSATVNVVEKTILFAINRIDFNLFLMQNPEVSIKLIETISHRLRDTNQKLKEISNENECLKMTLQESFSYLGDQPQAEVDERDHYYSEKYICPCCDSSISSSVVKNKFVDLDKNDHDLCPHYKNKELNPLFYEIVVCPQCGYAYNSKTCEKLSQQAKTVINEKLRKMTKPSESCGQRNLDLALEIFHYTFLLHDDRNISHLARADLCLKIAWLYRYKKESENEKKYIFLAQQRLMAAYEEEKYDDPQNVLYLMYMIAQSYLYTGDSAESLKWLTRVIQHPQKDQSTELVGKAKEIWQEIKSKRK